MSKPKEHGMKGKANASKGRQHWPKKTIQINPDHLKKAEDHPKKLTDIVDQALESYFQSI